LWSVGSWLILLDWCRGGGDVGRTRVALGGRHRPRHGRKLLVVAPALVDVGLPKLEQVLGPLKMANRASEATKSRTGSDGLRESSLKGWPSAVTVGWKRYSGQ
jgi:hypothetical protein